MEATEDIVVKRKRDESVVHLINSDNDTQEKRLIKNETKGLDRLIKTETIEDLMIDGVGINRKQDPLENKDRTDITNKIEEKGFTLDNDGCIIIKSVDLKVEKNDEPGNDPLEDGDGGCRLENEMCLVKLEDSKVYLFEGRALSTWMNEAQVLDFENNSGQVLESDGVVTYLGESERNITERGRDITEREHNIVNCQKNEKGGQGVLKLKETRSNSIQNQINKSHDLHRYSCIDCGSSMKLQSSFVKHRERRNCMLACEYCGDKFSRKDLQQHLAIYDPNVKFNKCQKYLEKFTSCHYETRAGDKTSTVGQIPVQSNSQIDSSSANTNTSGEHVSLLGSSSSDSKGDAFQPKFKRKNCALVKSVCEHCGSTFSRKDVKLHLAICATKEKYKCQKSSEEFTSRFSLLEHYETCAGNDTSTVGQIPVQLNGKRESSSANTITSGEHVSLSGSGPSDREGNDSQPKFKCQECNRQFSQLALLVSHSLVAHPSKFKTSETYNCKICSLEFESQAMYIEHLTTHSKTKVTPENIKVSSMGSSRRHHKCYSCHTVFDSHYKYINHMLTHSNTITSGENVSLSGSGPSDREGNDSQPKFECQECNRQFSQRALLVSHSLVAHPSKFKTSETYNCKICSLEFESQAMYIEHLMTHSKTKVTPENIKVSSMGSSRRHHKCYSCHTVFDSHYKYINHMLTHSKSKPENNETEIHLEGDYYDRYIKHMLTHSKSNPMSPSISSQQSSGKRDDSSQITSNHLGNSNDLSNTLKDNASKLINNCRQNVEKHSDLPSCQGTSSDKQHKRNSSADSTSLKHNLNFKIPSCPRTSNVHIETPKHFGCSEAKNKRRLESIDAGESPYKIPKCPKEIKSEKNKTPNECFICQLCHIAFKSQMALSAHERVHIKYQYKPNDSRLKCQQCGEWYKSTLDLYKHMILHCDKPEYYQSCKKYECWMCLKEFGCKKALQKHISIIGNRPAKCSVCNKSFWRACSLSQHMNTHTTNSVTPE